MHHTGVCSVSSPRAARRNVSFFSLGKPLGLRSKEQVQTVTHRVWVPCQASTTGAEGASVSGSSPLPDRRRDLRLAVTNVINSPHHSPGPLPAKDSGAPSREEAMPCPGPARLSYRRHQLLPPGETWDKRGAGRAVLHSPPICARPRVPSLPRPQPPPSPASPPRGCWSPACPGEGDPGNRGACGNKVPKISTWDQCLNYPTGGPADPSQCRISNSAQSLSSDPVPDSCASTITPGPLQCLSSVPRATPVSPVQDLSTKALS